MDIDENEAHANQFMEAIAQKVDTTFKPTIVFPGQDLTSLFAGSLQRDQVLKIGAGLVRDHDRIISTLPGQLSYRPPSSYWVDVARKRYMPKVGDQVVGVIDERGGDFYVVNIFTGANCILNRLSFEGATKRNKPDLKKGDVIYARVEKAGKDIDTELTCISSSGVKKDWSSGETVYGNLPDGLLLNVSLPMAKRLLRPDCAVLNTLGRHLAYELAVGLNGAVWLRVAGGSMEAVLVRNAVLNSEMLTDLQAEAMVEQLLKISAKLAKR